MTPVRPPNRKVTRNPMMNSIGASHVRAPDHMLPTQLKNLIPVWIAIRKDMREKNGSSTAPVVNMWCAHTVMDRPAIATVAAISVRSEERRVGEEGRYRRSP